MLFFPNGCDDEVLISICSSYDAIMRYPNRRHTMEDLFDNPNVKVVLDFPCHIAALARGLGMKDEISFLNLVDLHTLLPMHSPFLSVERYKTALHEMLYGDGGKIHLLLGIVGSETPKHQGIMMCRSCVGNDQHKTASAFIHRSHQAKGIKVCSEHGEPLQCIPVEIVGQTIFHNLERLLSEFDETIFDITYHGDWNDHLYLAKQTRWLLDHPTLPLGEDKIRQRFLIALAERGFATFSGEVRVEKLTNAFIDRFMSEFLSDLGCELIGRPHRNWLSRLLQTNQPQAPIRYLLLMRFLGITFEEFLNLPLQHEPFGIGPWPCLNNICPEYKNRIIQTYFMGYSPNTERRPLGTFVCPSCGFTYSRVGPDRNETELYRIGRVVHRGHYWHKLFMDLWNADHPEKYIAKQLMVHPETIKRYAVRQGLIEAPEWLELKIDEDASRFRELDIEQCKLDWLKLQEKHPKKNLVELMELEHQIYATLFRLEAQWLEDNSPKTERVGRKVLPQRVNWSERDQWLLIEGPKAVDLLLQTVPLVQVSFNSIAIVLGWKKGSISKNKNKLTYSYKELEKFVESDEDFAIRRIDKIANQLMLERKSLTQAALVKAAGISKSLQTPQVMQHIQLCLDKMEKKLLW